MNILRIFIYICLDLGFRKYGFYRVRVYERGFLFIRGYNGRWGFKGYWRRFKEGLKVGGVVRFGDGSYFKGLLGKRR